MPRKVYKCRRCGSRVEVLQEGGGLSCCGVPLNFWGESRGTASPEEPVPLIDLVEVQDKGKSRWQLFDSGKRHQASERLQVWEGDSGGFSAG